jgi:hypothetical protein
MMSRRGKKIQGATTRRDAKHTPQSVHRFHREITDVTTHYILPEHVLLAAITLRPQLIKRFRG